MDGLGPYLSHRYGAAPSGPPSMAELAQARAQLQAQDPLYGFGYDAFGAPGWMPGPLAPYWDAAVGLLRDMGQNTVTGFGYLARLPGHTLDAGKDALGTVADLAASGATRAATKVREKSRELERKFEEYQAKGAEFDRKLAEIARTDPAGAQQLERETYGAMAGAKAAFLQASAQFARASGAMSDKTIRIIRRLRAEGTTETLSGEDFGLADAGVVSVGVPGGVALASAVAAVVIIVAAIWLLTALVRDLTIGTQQADQTLFEQERQRALEDGATEEEATDRALETVETLGKGRLNINEALPWVFGIAAAGIGLPVIYRVVKDLRG